MPTPQRTIAAGDVGSRIGLRGTGAHNCPATVAHPMALGVTGASAWAPAAIAPAPPRPAPPPEGEVLEGGEGEDDDEYEKAPPPSAEDHDDGSGYGDWSLTDIGYLLN